VQTAWLNKLKKMSDALLETPDEKCDYDSPSI
jgi:predicted nucleic acid-binding Zn ribbon protein